MRVSSPPGARVPSLAPARDGWPLVLAVAFVAGFACLAVEFAIVRLCAPWFGQGTHVWANTVAVVLFALALGYGLGGRIADRGGGTAVTALLLVAAALWLAGAALFGARLAAWLAPASLGADRPHPLSLFGSLAGTAALAGPPLLAVGAMTPILVAWRTARSGAGRATGIVAALGTLGGLVGCAVVPMLVVPRLGSRGVLLVAAGLLALSALAISAARSDGRAAPSIRAAVERSPIAVGAVAAALVAAFLCGIALTLVEFATVRRLAPRYGSDNATWATAIGTVLALSALGSVVGGFGRRSLLPLAVAWLAAPCLIGIPTGPGPRTTLGLIGHAIVAAFGVYHLAAVPPVLVETLSRRGHVGRSVSWVFGVSTLGNVLGCYLAPLLLLPAYGTRATFLAAAILASVGVAAAFLAGIGWRTPRAAPDVDGTRAPKGQSDAEPPAPLLPSSPRAGLAVPVIALVVTMAVGLSSLAIGGPLRVDPGQLEEVETAYSTVRVVEREEFGPEGRTPPLLSTWKPFRGRSMGFDEDTTSYQSVRFMDDEATVLTGGRYYEHLAIGAWFTGQPWASADGGVPRVLIVGYCGGTLHRVLAVTAPKGREPDVTGIEIDPAVVDLAVRRFGPLPANLRLHAGEDGRAAMAALPDDERFDLIVVDAYQRTQYVPFHLSTVEFFRECRRRLTPRGVLGINSDSELGASGRLVRCLAESVAEAFDGRAWLVPNPLYPGNVAIWGTVGAAAPRVASGVDARLETAAFCLDRLLVRYVRGGGRAFPLTDDRAPTEALADDALLHAEEAK